MSTTTNTATDGANPYQNKMDRNGLIMYYNGRFDDLTIAQMIRHIRDKCPSDKPGIKVFAIFMELANNISRYSHEKNFLTGVGEQGIGQMVIRQDQASYTISAKNIVTDTFLKGLFQRFDIIQSTAPPDLRKLKRSLRSAATDANTGNIGLVQVAIKADQPLMLEVDPVGTAISNITISATVHKKQA